jgi:hypothetical protein
MFQKLSSAMTAEVWQLAFTIVIAVVCYLAEMFTRALPKTALAFGVLLLGSPVYMYLWLDSSHMRSDGSHAAMVVWLAGTFVSLLLVGLGIFMIVKSLRQINAPTGAYYIYGQSSGFRFNDPDKISKS